MWYDAFSLDFNESAATVSGLSSGQIFDVRVASAATPAVWSDTVVHRTAHDNLEQLEVYRQSEGCKEDCVGPDYLYNHDTGTAAADMYFITSVAKKFDSFLQVLTLRCPSCHPPPSPPRLTLRCPSSHPPPSPPPRSPTLSRTPPPEPP